MAQTNEKTFGQNIYRLRNAQKLTQEQLAEKADTSRRYVQLMEAGQHSPSLHVICSLRKGLNVSWDDLLAGIG